MRSSAGKLVAVELGWWCIGVDLQEGSVRSRIFAFSTVLIIEATMALGSVSCDFWACVFDGGELTASRSLERP